MEFGAHLGTVARSDNPYWYLVQWAAGLTESGQILARQPQAYMFDWLLRKFMAQLEPQLQPEFRSRMQIILGRPGFLSQSQGFSLIELLLDSGITVKQLCTTAEAYYEATFKGPLMLMNVLNAGSLSMPQKRSEMSA